MKILVIDDDRGVCLLIKSALTKQGYEVATFNDAISGIKHAQTDKPNLIFMDIMLPGLSGEDAVKQLQADAQLKDVPVVFLTALFSGEEATLESAGLKVNGISYVTLGKPYEINKLMEAIKKFT